MKVVSVVGARPNYVKLAAVYEAFSKLFEHVIVDTGQHYDYDMNKVFFDRFTIPEPLSTSSVLVAVLTVIRLVRSSSVLRRFYLERPDIVVVYGDTNSALGGALAAVKVGFRVAHVEAGLRSFDMTMPEEVNRRVIDHVSSLLFAPTRIALSNLLGERVLGEVYLVGDVHVYVLRGWVAIAEERFNVLERLGVKPQEYALVTLHRAENVNSVSRLSKLLQSVSRIAECCCKVVFPVHPRTRKNMAEAGLDAVISKNDNDVLTQPLGYVDFIKLLNHSRIVLTDSGGVQREAYLLRKPVVVLRKRTEWVKLVEYGLAMLYDVEEGVDVERILRWRPREYVDGLLGDESAPQRIAELIHAFIRRWG